MITSRRKCKQLDKRMSSTDFAEKVNLEEEMADEGMEGCVGGKNVTINSHDISKAQIQGHELVAPSEIPQVAHLPDIQNIRQDQEDDDKEAFFDRLVEDKADIVVDFLSPPSSRMAQGWLESGSTESDNGPLLTPYTELSKRVSTLWLSHPKSSDCPETDFRLSFSNAEYLLSRELNDIQRQCYRGLKKYYSVYLRTEPEVFGDYTI
ncbi:hypothetical protein OS493_031434 [Desmophyllum pertusum]|uniref:Uncharacterized protein n=1 Tax=Desmophyllum pertusum TaxID=174260 RepID=A0A9W9ZXS8_9CNID|nr:hypothetical protein OS493_031434 [Desmophyllum pertusum]